MSLNPAHRPPSLGEVLRGITRPPLPSDFDFIYIVNHCIEILNFLESAKRYRENFASCEVQSDYLSWRPNCLPEVELLRWPWQSFLSAFILPRSSLEVGVSTEERVRLLAYQNTVIPPAPCPPEPIVRRLYDQLGEEIFQLFLASQDQ